MQHPAPHGGILRRTLLLVLFLITLVPFTNTRAQSDDELYQLYTQFMELSMPLKKMILEATKLTDQEENELGNEFYQQIKSEVTLTTEPKYYNRVKNIYNKMKPHIQRKGINYTFDVVKTNEVNAFAIAGGHLFVNTGLMDFVANDDELAAVIGHEYGHVELRHCTEFIQFYIFTMKLTESEDIAGLVHVMYNTMNQPYSQFNEFEADEYGVHIMEKAGYNRRGAYTIMDKFDKEFDQGRSGSLFDKILGTHPPSKDRRDRINTY